MGDLRLCKESMCWWIDLKIYILMKTILIHVSIKLYLSSLFCMFFILAMFVISCNILFTYYRSRKYIAKLNFLTLTDSNEACSNMIINRFSLEVLGTLFIIFSFSGGSDVAIIWKFVTFSRACLQMVNNRIIPKF